MCFLPEIKGNGAKTNNGRPSRSPFSYCAVDYFGPWHVKEERRHLKRYRVHFTCLASRAVHLDVAYSLTEDSFINAYCRFVGHLGRVRQLYRTREQILWVRRMNFSRPLQSWIIASNLRQDGSQACAMRSKWG